MVKIHTDKNVADLLTKAFDDGIGVNAGDSKLMLLGINLLLLGKVNAARHKLTAAGEKEVAVDAIPLATKPPSIVDWKIHKKGKKSYYQITRANGSSKMYLVFSQLLKSFDRENLETLWRRCSVEESTRKQSVNLEAI
ncbi:hypothetical protein Tco_1552502 [Tanacetum coccineum]